MRNRRWSVILLPGGVMPAGPAFHDLLAELEGEVDARTKDLEVYEGPAPPAGYSLDTEVAGIERVADAAGFARFHLLGYSAGGAASLAYASRHADRLTSLALLEPAFAGRLGMGPRERSHWEGLGGLAGLPDDEMMAAFRAAQVAPDVEPAPPPPGPPPPWMAKRPAGLRTLIRSFIEDDLDLAALGRFDRPVWYALGGRSHPDYYAPMAERLSAVFPDFTLETFPDRHHFDPPHRIEPARVAASLRTHWSRAEALHP